MEQGLSADEFDEQALTELRMDLGASFSGFVEQFLTSANSALNEIDELLQGDSEQCAAAEVQAQAHSLRGTAGYLGAVGMADALDSLEQAARSGEGRDVLCRHAATARGAFLRIKARLLLPL